MKSNGDMHSNGYLSVLILLPYGIRYYRGRMPRRRFSITSTATSRNSFLCDEIVVIEQTKSVPVSILEKGS
jgi:hypothetical protein